MLRSLPGRLAPIACMLFLTIPTVQAQTSNPHWTGFFAGINLGYGSAKIDGHYLNGTTAGSTSNPSSLSSQPSGVIGGLQLGEDRQINRWVVGGQLSYNLSALSGTSSSKQAKDQIFSLFTMTARTGYLIQPGTLLYLRAGIAQSHTKHTLTNSTVPTSASANSTRDGWLLGVGFEKQVARHISFFSEFDYMDFGNQLSTLRYPTNYGSVTYRYKQKISTLQLGLDFRF